MRSRPPRAPGPPGAQEAALDERRVRPVVPDDERVDEPDADGLPCRPELLTHGHVGPARLEVPRRVVVGDEDAPGVAEEAEPEDLARAGHARVDRPDVADVGADDSAGRRERDGEEDLPVVPVEHLAAQAGRVGGWQGIGYGARCRHAPTVYSGAARSRSVRDRSK